jgi:WD40 repeat protein/energy-coupling factor transporter ATP-binding protein EcfA2
MSMPEEPEDAGTVPSRGEGHEVPPGGVVTHAGSVAGYRIDSLAGSGGMGVVYRATDTELGRPVALKLIAPERAADPGLRELFVRESLTAARLEHPNVIPIHRAGEDDGQLFIAMRFVEGASLQELIAATPGGIPPGRAARIVARVADALDAAHARGLVHRDVKPANILIADPDGEEHVYLTDFGLSVPTTGRAARGERGAGWAGTLSYLAPEQIDGSPLDARTDVYALGCVLFHALTGRAPFPGRDEEAVLEAHRSAEPPAPSSVVPGLPPAMDAVVRRAMAKRPEDRFATTGELGRAALSARYDVALLATEADRAAAETIAAGLAEAGMHALVATGGGPETAEGVRASGACAVIVGRDGLGDWARTGLSAARELAVRDRAFRLALVLLPGAPDPADPGLAYLATSPWVDLRAGVSDALAGGDLVRALRGADVPAGLPADSGECPYRGLEAFREEDAALYFGREQDTAQLIERLRTTRFVAVLGPSGSGKSSLVRAGLLPAVRRGTIPGGEAWRVIDVVPGEHPLAALAAGLAHLPGAGAPSPADLAADERALDVAVATALESRPEGERVMVLVDQLEEAFTLCADAGERAAFLGNLVYAATIPGGRVVVIASMRADFYHRLAEHPELRALVSTHQHLVGPMDARALRRAIEEPARHAGLELEPGLTRRILTDVADRPGTLPLLEHLLVELWQRRRGRTLTLEAYAASGGVEGALARRANEVYGAMPPERQALARRILLRLTQPGEGTEDTRRRATRSELVTRPDEEAEVDAVLESLTAARLVTVGRDPASDQAVVEVTHEALIRGWPELRGWLDEDRDRLRAERHLSDAAVEWDRGGREEGALYRGARLSAWEERETSDLTGLERAFLEGSSAVVTRERTARRRRVRVAVATLGAVTAVIAALAVVAMVQRNDASDQRDLAVSRELAANAQLQLPVDPEVSVLLAQQAVARSDTPEADQALREATHSSAVRFSLPDQGGLVEDATFSPDGTLVVTGGDDDSLHLWVPGEDSAREIPTGQESVHAVEMTPNGQTIASAGEDGTIRLWTTAGREIRALRGHRGPVYALDVSTDGATLVSGGADGTLRVWSIAGEAVRVVKASELSIRAVAINRDGDRLASGSDDGIVKVWTRRGALDATLEGHESGVQDVDFNPDGVRMASGAGDFTARLWNLERPTAPPKVLRASVVGAAQRVSYDVSGKNLLTVGDDGTVRVWTAEGAPLATLRGHEGAVYAGRFNPDGSSVLSAGDDGTTRIWQWRQGLPIAQIASLGDFPQDGGAVFTPGGDAVFSAGIDGALNSWNLRGSRFTAILPPLTTDGFAITSGFSDDTRLFAAAIYEGALVVRNTDGSGRPVSIDVPGIVRDIDFSDDGRRLVTGGDDGAILLWDLTTKTRRQIGRGGSPAFAVDLSSDGTFLATGSDDGTIRLWDLTTGAERKVLKGHEGGVLDVDLSSDGTTLVSSGVDRTVRIWDTATGDEMILRGHQGATYARFSPDEKRIISSSDDGVRIWDATTGAQLLQIASPDRQAYRAVLSPDGARIALQTFDARIQLLSCEVCGSPQSVEDLARQRVTRELTPPERATYGLGSES